VKRIEGLVESTRRTDRRRRRAGGVQLAHGWHRGQNLETDVCSSESKTIVSPAFHPPARSPVRTTLSLGTISFQFNAKDSKTTDRKSVVGRSSLVGDTSAVLEGAIKASIQTVTNGKNRLRRPDPARRSRSYRPKNRRRHGTSAITVSRPIRTNPVTGPIFLTANELGARGVEAHRR